MEKKINNNNHPYVDLDLPSGTLWATMNVGASKPTDYGLYFQWGDTSGYTASQIGTGEGQKKFSEDWSDYKWYESRSINIYNIDIKYKKYTESREKLELEDDAAHVNMGGDWHMPTPAQINELLSNTTNTWTTQDGVNGRLFTSKTDTSKSIFIPADGNAWDGSVSYSGDDGCVWSSMLSTCNVDCGQNLFFFSGNAYLLNYDRNAGFSVRGVIDKK